MEQAGLILDNIFNPKPNSWVNGKNMVIPNGIKSFHNELGFTEADSTLYPIVGRIATPVETVLFTSNDVISEIGIYKDGVYTPKLRGYGWFNSRYPVKGTYTYNHLDQLIIAWTDDNTSPKILNLSDMPFKSLLTPDLFLVDESEFTMAELFPNIRTSIVDITNVPVGGNLRTGVYYILCSYGYEDGSNTNWFNLSNPVSIYNSVMNTVYDQICGSPADEKTNKAINIKLWNIDQNYSYVNIGIISKIGGVLSATQFTNIPINGDNLTYSLSDLTGGSPISLTEILTNNPVYLQVKDMENVNGELDLVNVKGLPEIDFQTYANKIKIEWYRGKAISMNGFKGSYKDPIYINKFRGFRAGEVYGFLAGLKLTKGGYYGLYHIPGRAANPGDKTLLDNINYPNDCLLDQQVYKFQTRSTATRPDNTIPKGDMGYWENRNEVYPETFPVDATGQPLANKPVRHHKFPSISQLKEWGYDVINKTPKPTGGVEQLVFSNYSLDPLSGATNLVVYGEDGLKSFGTVSENGTAYTASETQKVSLNLQHRFIDWLPEAGSPTYTIYVSIKIYNATGILKATLRNYYLQSTQEILVGVNEHLTTTLEAGDKLVTSIIIPTFDGINNMEGSKTLNIDANVSDTSGDIYGNCLGVVISNIEIPKELEPYVEGIEIFYYERSLDNMTILDQSILLNDDWLHYVYGSDKRTRFHGFDLNTLFVNASPTHYMGELLLTKAVANDTVNVFTEGLTTAIPIDDTDNSTSPKGALRIINKTMYLPADNVSVENYSRENCLSFIANSGYALAANQYLLANLCCYKTDVYNSLFTQRVVSTGAVIMVKDITPASTFTVYGGDTFISPFGFMVWKSSNPSDSTIEPKTYSRRKYLIAVESCANIGLRYETLIPHEKFYPKTDIALEKHFVDGLIYQYGNFYGYNNDFTSVNNLRTLLVHSFNKNFAERFKYRVVRSLPQARESVSLKWRIFPPSLYYDMPMNKGEITGIISYGSDAFIVHKYTMYKVIFKDLLQLIEKDIYLAQGDIFDRPPVELMPTKEGYAGYQSNFAYITTEFGLLIVDRFRCKVYLLNEDLKELSNLGVENKLKEILTLDTSDLKEYPLMANDEQYIASKLGTAIITANPQQYQAVLDDIDNPFVGKGIVLNYDRKYRRALLTVINKVRHYDDEVYEDGQTVLQSLKLCIINADPASEYTKTTTIKFGDVTLTLTASNVTSATTYICDVDRMITAVNIKNAINTFLIANNLSNSYEVLINLSDIKIVGINEDRKESLTAVSTSTHVKVVSQFPYHTLVDKSCTYSIGLAHMFWLFKHDYVPTIGFNNYKDTYLAFNDDFKARIYNINTPNKYAKYQDDNACPSFIDIPLNLKDTPSSLFLENFTVESTVRDIIAKVTMWNKSITHYMIYTETQCTGLIPIITDGYSDEGVTAYFSNRSLVINEFRDMVIDYTKPFMDNDGNLILSNINGNYITNPIKGNTYIIEGIENSANDYLSIDGVKYAHNFVIVTIPLNANNISILGNAKLKTYKDWFDKSYISDKLVVLRLVYDNTLQAQFELTNVFLNGNKQ